MKLPLNIRQDTFLMKSFIQCKRETKHYARSFYFSSFLLPLHKRFAAYSIFDFCRYADNLMDSSNSDAFRELEHIKRLHEKIREIYESKIDCHDRFYALSYTVNRYEIPEKYFHDLLHGLEMDSGNVAFQNFSELRNYCYHVAFVVGLMLTHVFGVTDKNALRYAESLGIAMQLTNILRDIKEDLISGRIYIPKEDLILFGYSEEELKNSVQNEKFHQLMKFQVERARKYYEESLLGMPYLTDDGSRSTVVVMYKTYSGILKQIEDANYDIFSKRHYVSFKRKIWITIKYLVNRRDKNKFVGVINPEEILKKA